MVTTSDSEAEEEEEEEDDVDNLLGVDETDSCNPKAKTHRKLAKYGGPPLPAEWSHRRRRDAGAFSKFRVLSLPYCRIC